VKYTAHLKPAANGIECQAEFEVGPDEIEGLSDRTRDQYLTGCAIDALAEAGDVDLWFEEV